MKHGTEMATNHGGARARRSQRCEHGFELSEVNCRLCARKPLDRVEQLLAEAVNIVCALCGGRHVAKHCPASKVGRQRLGGAA